MVYTIYDNYDKHMGFSIEKLGWSIGMARKSLGEQTKIYVGLVVWL